MAPVGNVAKSAVCIKVYFNIGPNFDSKAGLDNRLQATS